MVKVDKNITLDEAHSMVAGKDSNISQGMPWEKISQRMEILYAKVVEQSELIGSLKFERDSLIEQIEFYRSLTRCSDNLTVTCGFKEVTRVLEKTNYYTSIYKCKKE